MDRALKPLVAAAIAAELGIWLLAKHLPDAHFPGFRLLDAGPWLVVPAVLGLLAAGLATRVSWPRRVDLALLALAALGVQVATWGLPQAQPDTVTYFVLAKRIAAAPVELLGHWPSLVWGTEEARFHKPYPLVPAVYGAAFGALGETRGVMDLVRAAFGLALPASVLVLTRASGRTDTGPAWVVATLPLILAQGAWMLVDVPLMVLLTLSWAAWTHVERTRQGVALAVALTGLTVLAKFSALLFLLPPLALLFVKDKRVLAGLGAVAVVGLLLVKPPFARDDWTTYVTALGAMFFLLRPGLWLSVKPDRLVLGGLTAVPLLLLYAPAEHAARYALPLVPLLALGVRSRPLTAFLAVSGLALFAVAWRPLLVNNQAANLQLAARSLSGFERVEIQGDMPSTTFPTAALTALVDLETTTAVQVGETYALGPAEDKRHWWEFYEPPAWHQPAGEPDAILLALYGAGPEAFEAANPSAELLEEVSLFRASSWLLPRRVRVYRVTNEARMEETR
ncbi:MAG: hypothetical protein GY884_32630 [Proteobacteria bacterium]|nr:hypothetical protein [Pseudomonadota bacterium]